MNIGFDVSNFDSFRIILDFILQNMFIFFCVYGEKDIPLDDGISDANFETVWRIKHVSLLQ